MDHLCYLCLVFLMLLRLFIAALWSTAGKGLTSWLLLMVFIVFFNFPIWYSGSGVVLDCIISWSLPSFLLLLAVLVRNPWKITKLPGEHSMPGHHWHASETPFKWCFAVGPMMARLQWHLDPLRKKQKRCQTWTPSDKTFWVRAWVATKFGWRINSFL